MSSSRLSSSVLFRLVAVLVALTMVAAACSGDDDDAAGDEPGTEATPEPTAIPTPTPSGEVDNEDLEVKPVVTVPDGDAPTDLTIDDVVVGDGDVAEAGDTLIMAYVGVSYSTGLQFDASWDRGRPLAFTLGEGQVITGWDDGIVGMAEGGRRELVIPPDLAYGEAGSGSGAIGPDETLIFVVDLIEVMSRDIEKPDVEVPAEPLAAAGAVPDVEVPDDVDVTEVAITDLDEGEGATASSGDLVVVRFVAVSSEDGSVLEQAWGPGLVRTFNLGDGQVGPGLETGIEGMAVGGVRQLVVPSEDTVPVTDGEQDAIAPLADVPVVYQVELLGLQTSDLSKPDVETPADPVVELEINDLVVGDGEIARAGETLVMQYVGVAQSTGVEFDASWDRGAPFTFTLGAGGVIRGWDEGIEGMAVGGRRELVIPPDLGYGTAGSGANIGPDETLVFVVDLIGVASAPQPEVTDLVVGDGAEAGLGSTLWVHYVGVSQSTGEQFDASWDRGRDQLFPFVLGVGQVIPGWDRGLLGMQVGGRRQIVIPPELAYGDQGAGDGVIAPNETLVFVIDLVAIS